MGYYKESGKINLPLTIIAIVIFSAILACIAFGYAWLTEINPFIYINFLATAVYAAITGGLLALANKLGKVRNFSASLIVAAIISGFGLYAVWVSYIAVIFEESFSFAISNFGECMDILSYRSFSISRTLRSSSVEFTGGLLYTLWVIEGLVLFVGPIVMVVLGGKNGNVYCEDCEKWAEKETVFLKRATSELTKQYVETLISKNTLNKLLELGNASEGDPAYFEIKFTACEACKKSYYLSIQHITNTKNSKNQNAKDEKLIFPFYELDMHTVPRDILNQATLNNT